MKEKCRLISSSGKLDSTNETSRQSFNNCSNNIKSLNQEFRYKKQTTNVKLRKINSFHQTGPRSYNYGKESRKLSLHDNNRQQNDLDADHNNDRLLNYKERDLILEELRNIADRYQQYEYKRYLTYQLEHSNKNDEPQEETELKREVNEYLNGQKLLDERQRDLPVPKSRHLEVEEEDEADERPEAGHDGVSINKVEIESCESQPNIKPVDPSSHYANGINLSFCGCGFLGIYHIGVASCFHLYAPQLAMQQVSGSSAGALVAVAYICGNLQLAYCTTDILSVAIKARSRALGPFHPSFDIQALVRKALECGLPSDVHERSNGKLHISLTRYSDGKNVIINQFDSKEEVIQALLCSCFIPFWSGLVAPKFRGVTYIDGGFSNNTLVLNDRTVTVSPFAGESDICPQDDFLNLFQLSISNTSFSVSPGNIYRLSHALLPPAPEILSDLCEQGFADGIRFMQKMKLISCTKCLEIRSSLLVTRNGEDMAEAFNAQDEPFHSKEPTSEGSGGSGCSSDLVASLSENNNHIRLEQQEQKMLKINESECSMTNGPPNHRAPTRGHDKSKLDEQPPSDNSRSSEKTGRKHEAGLALDHDEEVDGIKCHECRKIRSHALVGPLPVQFRDRIKDACDLVNKSLSNWLYSYRPIKYLSYLVAPYYMPLDVSIALVMRLWQEMPSLKSEMMNCLYNIAKFIANIFELLETKSSVTNFLFDSLGKALRPLRNEQNYVNRLLRIQSSVEGGSMVIGSSSGNNNRRSSGAMENKLSASRNQQTTSQCSTAPISHNQVISDDKRSNNVAEACDQEALNERQPDEEEEEKEEGSSWEAGAAGERLDQYGERIMEAQRNQDQFRATSEQPQQQATIAAANTSPLQETGSSLAGNQETANSSRQASFNGGTSGGGSSRNSVQQLHSLEDTFDSIVDVTYNQEARIFAYYFRDAKNRLQVTEIFDLERASDLQQTTGCSNRNRQQL